MVKIRFLIVSFFGLILCTSTGYGQEQVGEGIRYVRELTYRNANDNLQDTAGSNLASDVTTYFNPNVSIDAVDRKEYVNGMYEGYRLKGEPIKPCYLIRRDLTKYTYDENDSLIEIHFFRAINLNKTIQGITGIEEWVKSFSYPNENIKVVKYYDNITYDELVELGEKKFEIVKPVHDLFGTYKMALKTVNYYVSDWSEGWEEKRIENVQTGQITKYKTGRFKSPNTELSYEIVNDDTTYKWAQTEVPGDRRITNVQWSLRASKKDTTIFMQVLDSNDHIDTMKTLINGRLIKVEVVSFQDSFNTRLHRVTKDSTYPCVVIKRDSEMRIVLDKQYVNVGFRTSKWSEKRYVYDEHDRIIIYTEFDVWKNESVFRTYVYE